MLGTSPVDSTAIHWETPKKGPFGAGPYSLESLTKEFKLLLDPCANNRAAACYDKFYTPEMDGLKLPWLDNAFLNPPFDPRVLPLWLEKAIRESLKNSITVVALIPAYTGADFYHNFVWGIAEVRHIHKRVKFWQNGKPSNKSPNFDCDLAIYQINDGSPKPWD